jgi:hypothetical protein
VNVWLAGAADSAATVSRLQSRCFMRVEVTRQAP